jgi:hypothetical protein
MYILFDLLALMLRKAINTRPKTQKVVRTKLARQDFLTDTPRRQTRNREQSITAAPVHAEEVKFRNSKAGARVRLLVGLFSLLSFLFLPWVYLYRAPAPSLQQFTLLAVYILNHLVFVLGFHPFPFHFYSFSDTKGEILDTPNHEPFPPVKEK